MNLRRSSGERTAAHPMGGEIRRRVRLGGGQTERLPRRRGGEGDSYLAVVAGTRQLIRRHFSQESGGHSGRSSSRRRRRIGGAGGGYFCHNRRAVPRLLAAARHRLTGDGGGCGNGTSVVEGPGKGRIDQGLLGQVDNTAVMSRRFIGSSSSSIGRRILGGSGFTAGAGCTVAGEAGKGLMDCLCRRKT